MFLLVLFSIVVLLIAKRLRMNDRLKRFEAKFRIREDLYLAPNTIYQALRHIYTCFVTKKVSMWYYVEDSMLKNKSRLAICFIRPVPCKKLAIDGDDCFKVENYTYAEVYDIVLRLTYILVNDYKVKHKDIISLEYSNKPMFIFLWLALWNIGAVPNFLNYNLTNQPLVHSLKIVNTSQVFVDLQDCSKVFDLTKDKILEELPDLEINYIDEFELLSKITAVNSPKLRVDDKIRDKNISYYDPACLVYTSGTTGLPKAAVNSFRKLFFAAFLFPHALRITRDSNIYTAMPLYHGTASILGAVPALCNGATFSLGAKFSLSSYWTQVKLSKANTIQYVGEVCRYLVGSTIGRDELETKGKVRLAFGNGMRQDIWLRFKERFGIDSIGEFYASSEAPFAMTCYEQNGIGVGAIRNNGWIADKLLSYQYTLVKMEDGDDNAIWRGDDGFCRQPGVEEKGELIMRVLNPKNIKATFPGYLNNDQATYSKVIRNVFKKGDAWVRTDDLLKYDSLKCIHFVDRLGDTYRWKSENVSTTEVENEIMALKDGIEQAVVVGAKVPNHEGRCGYAIIQTSDKSNKTELLEKLSYAVVNNLPHYARPCFVTFASVQMTHNHKVPKKLFRDPQLPNGKNGDQVVYWLDPSHKSYKLLDEDTYAGICQGVIRI